MAAHLGAGLDVPDFNEVVVRASDDAPGKVLGPYGRAYAQVLGPYGR